MTKHLCPVCGRELTRGGSYCSPACQKEARRRREETALRHMRLRNADNDIYEELLKRLFVAQTKHPVFAEGPYQALGRVGEEYGELAQAINKKQGPERVEAEAWDLLVTAWRFVRRDWDNGEEETR